MQTRVIILAAGKGTRMKTDTPKALIPFEGKPLIRHLLDAVAASGVDPRPVIVTGFQAQLVEQTLGPGYEYVRQDEQLGTGHAVASAEHMLSGKANQVIVLYADHPFVRASRIRELRDLHEREQCPFSLMTVIVPDFNGWREPLADFSRIIRDESGKIIRDVQVKDAAPAELEIHEVNPALFCFSASWLWPHLKKLDNNNAKQEYYLTDLVKIAIDEKACIASMRIDPSEAIGLNTPGQLELAKNIIGRLSSL